MQDADYAFSWRTLVVVLLWLALLWWQTAAWSPWPTLAAFALILVVSALAVAIDKSLNIWVAAVAAALLPPAIVIAKDTWERQHIPSGARPDLVLGSIALAVAALVLAYAAAWSIARASGSPLPESRTSFARGDSIIEKIWNATKQNGILGILWGALSWACCAGVKR